MHSHNFTNKNNRDRNYNEKMKIVLLEFHFENTHNISWKYTHIVTCEVATCFNSIKCSYMGEIIHYYRYLYMTLIQVQNFNNILFYICTPKQWLVFKVKIACFFFMISFNQEINYFILSHVCLILHIQFSYNKKEIDILAFFTNYIWQLAFLLSSNSILKCLIHQEA